jgi:rhodanese-related sulfurtransferase
MKKFNTGLIASFAIAALALTGCSSGSTAKNLDAKAFQSKSAESGVVTVDVRTPGEFSAGHIKGAINIDVEGMQFDSEIAKLDKSATYAVYCHSGRRSAIAVEKMSKAGFTSLFNLTSGFADWMAQGLPVATV